MTTQPFYEIGLRSNFSFLEGASHAEELVERALLVGLSVSALPIGTRWPAWYVCMRPPN